MNEGTSYIFHVNKSICRCERDFLPLPFYGYYNEVAAMFIFLEFIPVHRMRVNHIYKSS